MTVERAKTLLTDFSGMIPAETSGFGTLLALSLSLSLSLSL
jgi:hypothetical protein